MTIKRRTATAGSLDPVEVAQLIEPHTLHLVLDAEHYREYFTDLASEVEAVTGVYDTALTMGVAEYLQTSPSDWLKHRLSRM